MQISPRPVLFIQHGGLKINGHDPVRPRPDQATARVHIAPLRPTPVVYGIIEGGLRKTTLTFHIHRDEVTHLGPGALQAGIRQTRPRIQPDRFERSNILVHKRRHRYQGKLQHNVYGPFKGLSTDSRTVTIQLGEFVERVSVDRVTRAPKHVRASNDTPYAATSHDMCAKNLAERAWFFKKILSHRKTPDGTIEFWIQWDGPYDPTWEPRRNIPEESVSHYLLRLRRMRV